jgi:ZIP family zinc transporter
MNSLALGALGGLISCLSTCSGALPSLYQKNGTSNPWRFVSLDFTLGMMLAASAFSLIIPAYRSTSLETLGRIVAISAALIVGALFIEILGKWIQTFQSKASQQTTVSARAWLFIVAMMIHNFPEGLASGASLNVENIRAGLAILASISIQNLPEGLMTALAFQSLGMSPRKALVGAILSGVMELSGGIIGGWLTTLTAETLPFMLAFAGGAMLYVSCRELWAESKGHPIRILFKKSFVLGFGLMASMSLISF